ncbi:MAG: LysR family transcriptional regulator [Lachnospiraceae bacterium]|nr:LysR family transcriptional regulator [Lachnospiraceae bacterium]
MDFRTLRYFVTVAQELNFTKAAAKLQMSQPPLSNAIRDMENDLGVSLFVRGKRHLQLTDAGRLLLQRATQILELGEKTRSDMEAYGKELTGRLFLGSVDGRAQFLAAGWITGFREEYPKVTFDLTNGSSDDVIDRLYKGLADLAIVAAPYDTEHLEGFAVGREPWVAIMSKDHPLAKKEGNTVTLKEISRENLIIPQRKSRIESIDRWFREIGTEINTVCTLSNYQDAVAMAHHNAGICIFPKTTDTPSPEIVAKTIISPAKFAEYYLVYPKDRPLENLPSVFVEFVKDMIEESGEKENSSYRIPEGADIL